MQLPLARVHFDHDSASVGDPAPIGILAASGVDYVSCSPHRVPVARLATAQAVAVLGLG